VTGGLDSKFDRRAFLGGAAALFGGAALAASPLGALRAIAAPGRPSLPRAVAALGPLAAAADLRDGAMRLKVPPGFTYRSFGVEGSPMADGNVTPSAHDGMGAFWMANGRLRLVRNHEIETPSNEVQLLSPGAPAFDTKGSAGTTTLELAVAPDGAVELVHDFVSLNGTHVNCSGGPSPWGSWLTCEETIEDDRPFMVNEENDEFQNGFDHRHGYVYEVPAAGGLVTKPRALTDMGRFAHEAVAFDPLTGWAYMTEDADVAGFYRFRPHVPGKLRRGGVLEMLKVKGRPGVELTTGGHPVGERLPVKWVTIDDPDPTPPATFEESIRAVFDQGLARGGAQFAGLEGCRWVPLAFGKGGAVVFAATAGGESRTGQIWAYYPTLGAPTGRGVEGFLELVYESPSRFVLNFPDQLGVSPRGSVIICEDGFDPSTLRALTPSGTLVDLAVATDGINDITGVTFSPSGRTLFFNFQGDDGIPAMTIAVWGPWNREI
jgi:uncharacterized protein